MRNLILITLVFFLGKMLAIADADCTFDQVGSTEFQPEVKKPNYSSGRGPAVYIDEYHHNFHTSSGRYKPFAELLKMDGYQVSASKMPFSEKALTGVDILVISNATAKENYCKKDWTLPSHSAFTNAEIEAVFRWVQKGGALLLVADHMPWPGAAEKMAAQFGIYLNNGFVVGAEDNICSTLTFRMDNFTLNNHSIVQGQDRSKAVKQIMSFCGQAFRISDRFSWQPLMTIPDNSRLLLPNVAWEHSEQTPTIPAGEMLQGATLSVGLGRVAVFGEASMFTAQQATVKKKEVAFGLNHPDATDNLQFVLNVMYWLASAKSFK